MKRNQLEKREKVEHPKTTDPEKERDDALCTALVETKTIRDRRTAHVLNKFHRLLETEKYGVMMKFLDEKKKEILSSGYF